MKIYWQKRRRGKEGKLTGQHSTVNWSTGGEGRKQLWPGKKIWQAKTSAEINGRELNAGSAGGQGRKKGSQQNERREERRSSSAETGETGSTSQQANIAAAAPDRWLFSFLSAQQKWPAPEKSLRRQSSSPSSSSFQYWQALLPNWPT